MANNIVEIEYNTELSKNNFSESFIKNFDNFFKNECERLGIDIVKHSGDIYIINGFKYSIVKLFFSEAENIKDKKELQKFWDTIEENSKKLKNYYIKILRTY